MRDLSDLQPPCHLVTIPGQYGVVTQAISQDVPIPVCVYMGAGTCETQERKCNPQLLKVKMDRPGCDAAEYRWYGYSKQASDDR